MTIQHYVVDQNIKGESQKKRGPVGYISQVAYKALCIAFASMFCINHEFEDEPSKNSDSVAREHHKIHQERGDGVVEANLPQCGG